MNQLFVALIATLITVGQCHLSMVCSATNPKKAGEIDFYFGTYHGMGEKAPGTVTISQPNVPGGAKISGSFTERFKTNFKITTVQSVKDNLIKAINDKSKLNKDCQFDCYVVNKASQAMKAPPKGQWMVPQPAGQTKDLICQGWSNMQSFSRLTITGAKSGDWFLEVSGTNDVYNPGQQQCSLSKNNPKWIGGMTVADGTPPCKGTPPVGSSIDGTSVANCKNMIGGAACTSFKCSPSQGKSAKLSGHIKCSKGKWDVTAKCMGESKCLQESQKGIDGISNEVSTCQATIDGLSDGAHCLNEMKGAVTAAQNAADGAAKTAKDADKAVSNAVATKVNFKAIPLNQLTANKQNCAGLESTLKANSNWAAATGTHKKALKAKTQADAQASATATALIDAKAAQQKAILKCQCDTKEKALSVFDKCQVNSKGQKDRWRKAHHLQCVEMASTHIDQSGKAQGTCKIPKVPVVTKKKMAKHVAEAKCMGIPSELQEDEEIEQNLAMGVTMDLPEMNQDFSMQAKTSIHSGMPGWHQMPDGEWMADSEMTASELVTLQEHHHHH